MDTLTPRRLYTIVLLTILAHFAFAGGRVVLTLFALKRLEASAMTVGLLVSLLAAVPMVFSIHGGRWVDRVGVWRPMVASACCIVLGTALAAAFPQLSVLFVSSVLIGSGFMMFHIAVNHAVGTMGEPQVRPKNFGALALGFSVSNFLGPAVVGFAIDQIGYRWTFVMLAVSAGITVAVLLAHRFDSPRQSRKPHAAQRHFTDLLKTPTMRRVYVVSGFLSMAWDAFSFVMPVYAARELHLSATAIGLLLAVFGSAIFFVRLVFPLFVHRVTEWQMLLFAMFSAATCLALYPLVKTVPLLVVLSFLLGIGLGGAQPMVMSLLYSTAPPGRGGEAVGIRTLLLNISQTGIPLLFGAAGTAIGMSPVFWTVAGALAAGGWYAARGRRP